MGVQFYNQFLPRPVPSLQRRLQTSASSQTTIKTSPINFCFPHFISNMDNQCQVCGQTRPCCRQSLFELADNRHPKLVIPVKGEIREAWGLGSVWKTCCGTVYGMYYDEGSNKYIAMHLSKDEEAALGRVKFVKNFIM